MESDSLFAWLGIILAGLVMAFASAAEVSLGDISRANVRRLREEGLPRAQALQTLLDDPPRFVTAMMVLQAMAFVAVSGLSIWLFLEAGLQWGWGVLLVLLIAASFLLVVQVLARALVMRAPEATALKLSSPVRTMSMVLTPVTAPLRFLADLVLGRKEEDASGDNVFLSEDELRYLISTAEEPGLIEENEKKMIASIFELGETVAREVMETRIDVVTLDEQTSLKDALAVIIREGHSRIPVFHDSVDNIQGVLYAKDLLPPFRDGRYDAPIAELMRPAYFVPESKKVDDLLRELQQRKVHMAIVVDEYGGTAGVVTIEDLLEEIVGDIQDEYDRETPMSVQLGEREYVFDAQIRLDEVREVLGVELPSEESDTLGGFIYSQLGSVPSVGSKIVFESLSIEVLSISGRRIQQVKVMRKLPPEPAAKHESQVKQSSLPASSTS